MTQTKVLFSNKQSTIDVNRVSDAEEMKTCLETVVYQQLFENVMSNDS